MSIIKIPGKLPNKSNQNQIRFAPAFWKAIQGIVQSFHLRGQSRLYWLGPSEEVKTVEEIIALHMRTQGTTWAASARLGIKIRLVRQRIDVDGMKALLDGIEKSGRIANDRQFNEMHIVRVGGKTPSIEFEVYEVGKHEQGEY